MKLLRRARNRLRDERGFTLMELIVATALGMVIVLATVALIDSAQTSSARVTARVDGTQRARAALEQLTQRLRSQVCVGYSTPVVSATADEITFFADYGDQAFTPEGRRFYFAGNELRERIWNAVSTPPSATFANAPTRDRVVISGIERVKDDAGNPMPWLTYFAYDAASPTEPREQLPATVPSADLPRVVRVQVAFRTRVKGQDERVDTNFVNSTIVRMANPSDPDKDNRGPQCA
jgi:type II secretory pathway pseudopilin PulG